MIKCDRKKSYCVLSIVYCSQCSDIETDREKKTLNFGILKLLSYNT